MKQFEEENAMAENHIAVPASIYIRCTYPSSAKLEDGQSWTVSKKVPINSLVATRWFKAMANAVKRRKHKQ